jgi:glycosyltransferase involved in cell wall biosynthesis
MHDPVAGRQRPRKTRILYVGPFELPDKNAAALRVTANAHVMRAAGYEPVLLGFGRSTRIRADSLGVVALPPLPLMAFEVPYPRSVREWMTVSIRLAHVRRVLRVIGEHTVRAVILYNYTAIGSFVVSLLCKMKGIKVALDITEWYGRSTRRFPARVLKDLDTCLRMRVVPRFIRNAICISRTLSQHFSRLGCHVGRIPFLVNDMDAKWSVPEGHQDDCIHLVFFGSVGKGMSKDRLDWIVDASARLRERGHRFVLHIVGISSEDYLFLVPEHGQAVAALGRFVVFHGRVSHADAIRLVRAADYSLLIRSPGRNTNAGFPAKLTESFACGVPLIATPVGDVAEFVRDGVTGFVAQAPTKRGAYGAIERALSQSRESIGEMRRRCRIDNPLTERAFVASMQEFLLNLA